MRVLFDQATPVPLRSYLTAHHVGTAFEYGWSTLRNGDLLSAAEQAGFDVLLTTDKNMRYQQNLRSRRIAIVVLGEQQWPKLRAHVGLVAKAVDQALPGSYFEVELPDERTQAEYGAGS